MWLKSTERSPLLQATTKPTTLQQSHTTTHSLHTTQKKLFSVPQLTWFVRYEFFVLFLFHWFLKKTKFLSINSRQTSNLMWTVSIAERIAFRTTISRGAWKLCCLMRSLKSLISGARCWAKRSKQQQEQPQPDYWHYKGIGYKTGCGEGQRLVIFIWRLCILVRFRYILLLFLLVCILFCKSAQIGQKVVDKNILQHVAEQGILLVFAHLTANNGKRFWFSSPNCKL